ncbi:hypothetical protein ACFO5K_12805 [Nocardia halotolerans]|uniref:Uncharacterized protein n=2 Tax=Nocardia halotolerans TaxID=1755878 RepID=A0ABV8VH77_9NOCA
MNNIWRELMNDIESGQYHEKRASESSRVPVVDDYSGHSYGNLVVDGNGTLRSIMLDPDEVVASNESDILKSIIWAINLSIAQPLPEHKEGGRIHG